jgi:hypothetical protein
LCPPHPAHVLLCGRGVEALLLAILDGHHALSKPHFVMSRCATRWHTWRQNSSVANFS